MSNEKVGFEFSVDASSGEAGLKAAQVRVDALKDSISNLTGVGNDASKSLEVTKGAATETGQESTKAAGGVDGLFGAMRAHPIAAAAAAGLAALAGAGLFMASALRDSMTAYEEQAEVNNVVEASVRNLGGTYAEGKKALADYTEMAGRLADLTVGTGDEAILAAAGAYNDLTQEVHSAAEMEADMTVILGISATRKKDATAASRDYVKALGGDVGVTKELIGLTKEQEANLNKMTDAGERGAKIQELLTAKFAGAASNVHPYLLATDNLSEAWGDLQQSIGGALVESGAFEPVAKAVTSVLRDLESMVGDNGDAVRDLVFNGMDKLIEGGLGVIDVLAFMTPVLTGLFTYLRLTQNWFSLVFDATVILGKGLVVLGGKYISFVTDRLGDFLGAAAEVASYVNDDFAAALRSGSDSLEEFSGHADGFADSLFDELIADTKEAGGNVEGMIEAFTGAPAAMAAMDAGIAALRERITDMREALKVAKDEVRDEGPGGTLGGGIGDKTKALEGAEASLAALEKERAALELRDEIARRQLEILQETGEAEKARLEYALANFESLSKSLTETELMLDLKRNDLQLSGALADIEKARLEAQKKRFDDAKKARAEELKGLKDFQKAQKEAQKESFGMFNAISDLAAGVFEKAGMSARGLSVIRAAQYAAEAIGAGLFGNPLDAIKAGIASAQHAAVALGSGGGGSGNGGSVGGGSASAAPAQKDVDAQEVGKTIADELKAAQAGPGAIYLTIDQRGSTLLENDTTIARRLSDIMKSTLRLEGVTLGGF